MTKEYDLVVVGAGWFGLSAAKSYIQFHPEENVLVLDAAGSIGGTWSEDRLYPGLKSNNLYGSYEYPDFRMSESVYGVKEGQHIPAAVLHRYLNDFAKHFGVFELTRLNTKVEEIAANSSGGWTLTTTNDTRQTTIIETKRLVLATGLTSQPNIPEYPGIDSFTPPFFHAKDFCTHKETVKSSNKAVVVGAGKSAYDIAYAFATEGDAQVDLIIRPTGQGPVWLAPPYVTPFKRKLEELLNTRALTWFSPCPWGDEDGFAISRNFLHNTVLGRLIVDNYWNTMSADVIEANGYDDDSQVFKLKPWNASFWTGSGLGINNFDTDFFELVKNGKIRPHIADVEKLDGKTVHLTNGEKLETDVVICATGWKKESQLSITNIGKGGTGLLYTSEERAKVIKDADRETLKEFPSLKHQPVLRFERQDEEPLRLYRFIVPPTMAFSRNLAFAGMVSTVSTAMFASVQGLWITAFFDNKLSRMAKTDDEVTKEVIRHTQFGKGRYPCGYGAQIGRAHV